MNKGAPVDTLRPITYLGIIPFVPRNLARCISRVPFLSYPGYSWQSLAIIVETCISLPMESNDKIRETTKLLKSRFNIYPILPFFLYFCAFLRIIYKFHLLEDQWKCYAWNELWHLLSHYTKITLQKKVRIHVLIIGTPTIFCTRDHQVSSPGSVRWQHTYCKLSVTYITERKRDDDGMQRS